MTDSTTSLASPKKSMLYLIYVVITRKKKGHFTILIQNYEYRLEEGKSNAL